MKSKLSTLRLSLTIALAFIIASMNLSAQGGGDPRNDRIDSTKYRFIYEKIVEKTMYEYDVELTMSQLMMEKYNVPREETSNIVYSLNTEHSYRKLLKADSIYIQNGNLYFYPKNTGSYYFEVTGKMSNNPAQNFTLCFMIVAKKGRTDIKSYITGTITLTIPENLRSVFPAIRGYQIETVGDGYDHYYEGKVIKDATIPNKATYTIPVPKGNHQVKLRVYLSSNINDNHFSYLEYYYSADNLYQTPVDINFTSDSTVVADFNLTEQHFPDFVKFTSDTACHRYVKLAKEQEFTHQLAAVSSKGTPITYEMHFVWRNEYGTAVHASMTPEGLLKFSSSRPGRYTVGVSAKTGNDTVGTARMWFDFKVLNTFSIEDTVKCAVIKGNVQNLDTLHNDHVQKIPVIVYAILKSEIDNPDREKDVDDDSYTMADSLGNYSLRLAKGEYYVVFSSPRMGGYRLYKDAKTYAEAEAITVNCGDTITLDSVKLKARKVEPPTSHAIIAYKIKGRVYDAQDQNKGVKAQLKIFSVANNNGNDDDGEDEYGKRGYTFANSDANGNYEISFNVHVQGNLAVPTIPIKLLALPFRNKGNNAVQYEPQYYNQVATIEEASVITLDSNFIKNKDARFNFPLVRKQSAIVWKHVIKGKVSNSDNTQNVMGLVTLIRKPDSTQANNKFEFKNVPTDTVGGYKFDNVRPGKYIVFAIPIAAPLMPGFYKTNDLAAWSWEEASEIVIPNDTVTLPEANYLIKLRNFSTNGGSGIIRGKVAANGAAQGIIQGSSPIDLGLGSVFMGIFDNNGKAVRYTYTDENGNFSFTNLAGGKFTVTASKYGYSSATQTIEVSLDKNGAATEYNGASLILTKKDPTSSVLDNQAKEAKVYPNPANAIAKIDFEAESGKALMTISDVQGNVILMNNISTNSGANTQDIDTRSLSNGLYIIQIQTETGKIISTMITVAK